MDTMGKGKPKKMVNRGKNIIDDKQEDLREGSLMCSKARIRNHPPNSPMGFNIHKWEVYHWVCHRNLEWWL